MTKPVLDKIASLLSAALALCALLGWLPASVAALTPDQIIAGIAFAASAVAGMRAKLEAEKAVSAAKELAAAKAAPAELT